MEKLKRTIEAEILSWEELSEGEQALIIEAIGAREHAQAPYSHFFVGSAVLTEDGGVFGGCNVERASYTQTTHAEQNAVDTMVKEVGSAKIAMIATVASPENYEFEVPPVRVGEAVRDISEVGVPCGHCLQIVWENCYNDPNVKIIELLSNGQITRTTMGDAFPMRFGPVDLGIDYSKK